MRVLAAFWAAENTVEKNPVCPGVVEPFSRVGVNGAEVIFESLLGPNVEEFVLARRCDIMLPDGDVTTLGLAGAGESTTILVGESVNRGRPGSVGVGGVLTMRGA